MSTAIAKVKKTLEDGILQQKTIIRIYQHDIHNIHREISSKVNILMFDYKKCSSFRRNQHKNARKIMLFLRKKWYTSVDYNFEMREPSENSNFF